MDPFKLLLYLCGVLGFIIGFTGGYILCLIL
jgi:uncharacterized membrane protein YheB (UPF0754 family)